MKLLSALRALGLALLLLFLSSACEEDEKDTAGPSITILAPSASASLSGIVLIRADISDDSAIEMAMVFIDDALVATLSSPPWEYSWNTAARADNGLHTIVVRAEDEHGNVGESAPVTVLLEVPQPILSTTPSSMIFGETQTSATLEIRNTGGETLSWSLASAQSWITFSTSSGNTTTETDAVTVFVNRSGRAAGEHIGQVTVNSNGGTAQIAVSMEVAGPSLVLDPASLDFGSEEQNRSFTVSNGGAGSLSYNILDNASWLSVSPASGTSSGEADVIAVQVNRQGLAQGAYDAAISVVSNAGTETLPVSMSVPGPTLGLSTEELSFSEWDNQLNFWIENYGAGDLDWNVSSNQGWLSVTPASGSAQLQMPDQVQVYVDRGQLSHGTHEGTLFVSSNGGSAQIQVSVIVPTLTITMENQLLRPVLWTLSGVDMNQIQPGETWVHEMARPGSVQVSWQLISYTTGQGDPIGDSMEGFFSTVNSPGEELSYTIDHIIGSQLWYVPVIDNNTNVGLLMASSYGQGGENRCNCVVPAFQTNTPIGYYRLNQGTILAAFRDGSNYNGNYIYWQYGTHFTEEHLWAGSGRVTFIVNQAPNPGARPRPGGVEAADSRDMTREEYMRTECMD